MYRLSENKREGNNQEGQCTVYTHKHSYWLTVMFDPLGERFFLILFYLFIVIIIIIVILYCVYHLNLYNPLTAGKKYIYLEFYKKKKMNIFYF